MGNLLNMSGGSLLNKGLPYDAEIEYLKSDGNAYIDTDIVLTSAHIVDIDFTHYKESRLVGARGSSYQSLGVYDNYIDLNAYSFDISQGRITYNFVEGKRYKVHVENGNRQVKDEYGNILQSNTYRSNSFNTVYKTPVFALRWRENEPSPAVGCIHALSITYNGNKLIDFIPVRIGTTGYMYDKVSKQLFGNSGTGNFILGNDI